MIRSSNNCGLNPFQTNLNAVCILFPWETMMPVPSHGRSASLDRVNSCRSSKCGEKELVSGVHTLVAGVVQVYHRLQVVEEEEKVRK